MPFALAAAPIALAAAVLALATAALALAAAALWIRRRGAGLVQAVPAPMEENVVDSSQRGRPDRHQPAVRAAQR